MDDFDIKEGAVWSEGSDQKVGLWNSASKKLKEGIQKFRGKYKVAFPTFKKRLLEGKVSKHYS